MGAVAALFGERGEVELFLPIGKVLQSANVDIQRDVHLSCGDAVAYQEIVGTTAKRMGASIESPLV